MEWRSAGRSKQKLVLTQKQTLMKAKLLPNQPEWRTCRQCGGHYTASQEVCEKCTLPQSKPEFLAGLITITLAVAALYLVLQL